MTMTTVALLPTSDAWRQHERWLERPHAWSFWETPQTALRMPLPSVWGLEPVRRLAGSLELEGRVCVPVPATAFHSYDDADWYRRWLKDSVEIENRAAEDALELFPELLGRESPVALHGNPPRRDSDDPQGRVRSLTLLAREIETLVETLQQERRWSRYSVEWASCRALSDACHEALGRKMSVVLYPEWPQVQPAGPVVFHTIAVRGLHRIRAVRVVENGEFAEVTMVNGQVFRVRAQDAFEQRGVLIARAAAGRQRAVVVLTDDRGRKVQLTPHRLLHLCDPAFRDD